MQYYNLMEYNISKLIIDRVIELGMDYNQFIQLNKFELKDIINLGDKKTDDLYQAMQNLLLNNSEDYISIYNMMHYKVLKPTCDILLQYDYDLERIVEDSEENIVNITKLSHIKSVRVRKSAGLLLSREIKEKQVLDDVAVKAIIKKYIQDNCTDEAQSILELKNKLNIGSQIVEFDKLKSIINTLMHENYIQFNTTGILYNPMSLADFLVNLIRQDEKKGTMIKKKFEGYTLQEIAEMQSPPITRERVRQIIKKRLIGKPKLKEDKYRKIFEKYCWSREVFQEVFSETEITYFYLKEFYVKGSVSLFELFKSTELVEHQMKKLAKYLNFTTFMGEQIEVNFRNVVLVILKNYKKDMTYNELKYMYESVVNNELNDYDLPIQSSRNFTALVSRFPNVIYGFGQKCRYYEYDILTPDVLEKLRNLLILPNGVYSSEYIYRNNTDLMEKLDILNHYELHYIYNNLVTVDESTTMLKMPNFMIGYEDRKDFYDEKILDLAPISLDDFIDYLHLNYGHKENTIQAYIQAEYGDLITEDIIKLDYDVPEIAVQDKLIQELGSDVYLTKEFKRVFISILGNDYQRYYNKYFLKILGYCEKNGFLISTKFSTSINLIRNKIKKNGYYIVPQEQLLNLQSFYGGIERLCADFKIVRWSKLEYISIERILLLGISLEDIKSLKEQFLSIIKEYELATLILLRKKVDLTKYDELGIEDYFYEDLIRVDENIKTLKIGGLRVFSVSDEPISIKLIIEREIAKINTITLHQLHDVVLESYGIELSLETIKANIKDLPVHYNDVLEKIYTEREAFYMEVK